MLMGMRADRRREEAERRKKWRDSLPKCETCGQIIYPPEDPTDPTDVTWIILFAVVPFVIYIIFLVIIFSNHP